MLKRIAINNQVRNEENQPMITYDSSEDSILLCFNISKEDIGRSEYVICMKDIQEMSYFEMNDDAAIQNNIDLDLYSFISFRAKAVCPGPSTRKHEYAFELEFEEDEHLRDVIQLVEDSGDLTPSQTQPKDIKWMHKH